MSRKKITGGERERGDHTGKDSVCCRCAAPYAIARTNDSKKECRQRQQRTETNVGKSCKTERSAASEREAKIAIGVLQ